VNLRAALADVAEFGPFFEVDTNPAEAGDPTWRPLTDLYTDPAPLAARIAHVARVLGDESGPVDDRVAASIAFQGMAARVLSPPLAVVVLHAVVPALTAATVHWRVSATGPWPLWAADPQPLAGADLTGDVRAQAAALAGLLVDEHLSPLVEAVRAQVSISPRTLWGNVASSVAAGKRLIGSTRPHAAARAAEVATAVLDHPALAGTGDLLAARPPDVAWTFRRRSCCLFYRAPGRGLCGDCVLTAR
jgi:ferric iron reductase protein FhuF